jgi:hypothetical protein
LERIALRDGRQLENPLAVVLGFVEAYPGYDVAASPAGVFDERDLKHANRGGARISAAEQALVLGRRPEIERALRRLPRDASLADPAAPVPWPALTRLFDAFGGLRGVGFSKMTKALHPKRPGLIPILDSVVQAYLASDEARDGSFGERATAAVRSYKRDLDRNRHVLRALRADLAARGQPLTEVRILDILIWSAGEL